MPKIIVMSKKKPAPPMESEALTCPKCGAELADTPKNRKYMAMRGKEVMEDKNDMEDEYEDEDY